MCHCLYRQELGAGCSRGVRPAFILKRLNGATGSTVPVYPGPIHLDKIDILHVQYNIYNLLTPKEHELDRRCEPVCTSQVFRALPNSRDQDSNILIPIFDGVVRYGKREKKLGSGPIRIYDEPTCRPW